MLLDCIFGIHQILMFEWVGFVVRKGAVELEVERHEIDVKPLEDRQVDRRHAIGGVGGELEARLRNRHPGQSVFGVFLEDRTFFLIGLRRQIGCDIGVCHQPFELVDSGFVRDRDGVPTRHLEAVVDRRVVTRSDLNAPRRSEKTDPEVVLRRVGNTDIDHRNAAGAETVFKGPCHRDRVRAHVPRDHDNWTPGEVFIIE